VMNNRRFIRIGAMAGAFVLSGCAGFHLDRRLAASPDDWTMAGRTAARTHRAQGSQFLLPLHAIWSYHVPAGFAGEPLVEDSVVVLVTMQGEIHALDLGTGRRLGVLATKGAVTGTPVIVDSTLYVATAEPRATVSAWNLLTGGPRWKISSPPVDGPMAVMSGRLIIPISGGSVRCVNATDGGEIWTVQLAGDNEHRTIRSAPAADTARAYVALDDGRLVALRLTDGSIAWDRMFEGGILASPLLLGRMIVVASLRGTVAAVDQETGKRWWTEEMHAPIHASLASDASRIFAGASDGLFAAYDIATGAAAWSIVLNSPPGAAPLVSDSLVIIGTLDRTVRVVSGTTGSELWRTTVDGRIRVSPVSWRGILLIASDDHTLTAYSGEAKHD
jgi:outer membrane protein assembly factor BamB